MLKVVLMLKDYVHYLLFQCSFLYIHDPEKSPATFSKVEKVQFLSQSCKSVHFQLTKQLIHPPSCRNSAGADLILRAAFFIKICIKTKKYIFHGNEQTQLERDILRVTHVLGTGSCTDLTQHGRLLLANRFLWFPWLFT